MKEYIYVASSWRNTIQPMVVRYLRDKGYDVYDFRKPDKDDCGFQWADIDLNWTEWDTKQYIKALEHPLAETGFKKDYKAMERASACLLVMPCGRSAHLEAGYFVGANKPLIILTNKSEPELMYKMANYVTDKIERATFELRKALNKIK